MSNPKENAKQTAYQLMVSEQDNPVESRQGLVWTSEALPVRNTMSISSTPYMIALEGKVSQGYCFAHPGTLYVLYSQNAEGLTLDLSDVTGDFTVRWYDPARGGALQTGRVLTVTGVSRWYSALRL